MDVFLNSCVPQFIFFPACFPSYILPSRYGEVMETHALKRGMGWDILELPSFAMTMLGARVIITKTSTETGVAGQLGIGEPSSGH